MTKQPILVEVFAWNETLLGLYAVGWALFVTFFRFEGNLLSFRLFLGAMIAGGGLAILLVQDNRLRTWLDFTLRRDAIKFLPKRFTPWLLRLWPPTTTIRLWNHFWFTVWWILMGTAVLLRLDDVSDVRFLAYFVIAAFHFDRLLRLLRGMRH